MLKDAKEKDKAAIYSLWQGSFSIKNSEMLSCFFNRAMDLGKTVIQEVDDKIVSTIHMNDFTLMLGGFPLKATYLSHIATHPDYRHAGYMSECMRSVLDECEKRVLFTFVEATNPKLWESFGFQKAVTHRYYELGHYHLPEIECHDIFEDATAEECLSVYEAFVQHFDGYKVRSLEDFNYMLTEAGQCHERVLVHRVNGIPKGYIRFVVLNQQVKVKEVVYLGGNTLLKLCRSALAQHETLVLEVSEAEHVEKLFPMALPRKRVAVMVRCNNLVLFNKLYRTKVKNSKDAYAVGKKIKYLNEKF